MKRLYSYLIIFLLLLVGLNFWLTYYIQQKHTVKIEERLEISNKWASNSLILFFKDMISNSYLLTNDLDTTHFTLKDGKYRNLDNGISTIFSRQNYHLKSIKIYDLEGNFKEITRHPKTNVIISRYGNESNKRIKHEQLILNNDSTTILKVPFKNDRSLSHIEYTFNLTDIVTLLDVRCKRDEHFSLTIVSEDGQILFTGEKIDRFEQAELSRIESLFKATKGTTWFSEVAM